MKTNVDILSQIVGFAHKTQDYLKIVQAFLKGYDVFLNELKGKPNENE